MTLLLTQDRSADQLLVAAFLRSALVTVPMLLMLIGLAGWLVANNGFATASQVSGLGDKGIDAGSVTPNPQRSASTRASGIGAQPQRNASSTR